MTTLPPKNNKHGWSVENFETHRRPLTEFLKLKVLPLINSDECRRILIQAPVKSGKREMVEYLAVRDHSHNPMRVHAFVSSFHRVADEDQRNELKIHNMSVFSLKTKKDLENLIRWCDEQFANNKTIIIHIDECDFGTGEKQTMSSVYKHVRSNEHATTVLYSATPQEVLFSGEVDECDEYDELVTDMVCTGETVEYTPPETFCGPEKFLNEDLVNEATPFFIKTGPSKLELTQQGKEILHETRRHAELNDGRNITVLRLSYSELGGKKKDKKENKAYTHFVKHLDSIGEIIHEFIILVDKGETSDSLSREIIRENIQWSNPKYWERFTTTKPILIVIDQTSTRSTEWSCHDRINTLHDFRNTATFSTVSQALERVNHYSTKYGSFQPIKIYGHKKTLELSAGRIGYDEYYHIEWKMKKIDKRNSRVSHLPSSEPRYDIVSSNEETTRHPTYTGILLTEKEANRILQDIGCGSDIKVSPRVKGTIKNVPVYKAEFIECSETEWPSRKIRLEQRFGKPFQNPFTKSKKEGLENNKFKGFLREWRVFDFEDILQQPGWGVSDGTRLTICYQNQVLGIAVRYDTGEKQSVNSLLTCKSMYKNT